ncbi:acyltransferase family protein [Hufsiella ginkgonis]|uniref:Acyltransferase family protein n=1 Tax=Hufsiella ginkgonis TaxID=2695274 RepID=A0A7K1Y3R9_9SPHI|nr:acyltransferase [Hufsiella ginkgonis]MXV17925.1 acyltransferase family protein [Hufsiella ginkgonis]
MQYVTPSGDLVSEVLVKQPYTPDLRPIRPVNYEQIDTIRFITICFIIWGHCLLGWEQRVHAGVIDEMVAVLVLQAGKISTVIFFLVSGFLIRPKLQRYTLKSYFRERSPRVYFPWLSFIVLFMLIQVVQLLPLKELWETRDLERFIQLNYSILDGLLIYSAYWFITTYALSMALFVVLRKHADSWWLGAALGLITLFYCLNLHFQWTDTKHSKAILGYAAFVWTGMKMNKHFTRLQYHLANVPWAAAIGLLLALLLIASYEGIKLTETGCLDPFASNRFSNIILSVTFFLALLKFGKIDLVNKLNPRKTVYGIYLVHNILIFELTAVITSWVSGDVFVSASVWTLLIYQFSFFVVILCFTYLVVNRLSRSRLCWIIGIKPGLKA